MRKIKITALVLAVLMVMAAFAGCAGKADFEDLRQDFEDHINQSNKNQEDLAGDIKDNSDKIEEILGTLGQITGTLGDVNESLGDLKDQIDAAQKENDANDAADKEHAALQAAKDKAIADLDKIIATVETDRAHYAQADYEAIVDAVAEAKKEIDAAKTADEVTAAYNKADAVFKAKATIITIVTNYYKNVINNITLDSKDLINEIDLYLNGEVVNGKHVKPAIQVKYAFDYDATGKISTSVGTLPEAILEYDTGVKDAAGLPVIVNLINELQDAIVAYNFLVNTVVDLAEDADYAISAINGVYLSFDAANKPTNTLVINAGLAVTAVEVELYEVAGVGVGVHAKFLADANLEKLVTKLDAFKKAADRLDVLQDAYNDFEAMMEIGSIGSKYNAFELYTDATPGDATVNALAYRADYTKKANYDTINGLIAAWRTAYDVDFGNEVIIINKIMANTYTAWTKDSHVIEFAPTGAHTIKDRAKGFAKVVTDLGFYGEYLWNSALVDLRTQGYVAFATIKSNIAAAGSIRALSAENVTTFENVAASITAWKTAYAVDNYTFAKVIDAYSLNNSAVKTVFDYTTANDTAVTLVDFAFPADVAAANGSYTNAQGINEVVAYENIKDYHYTAEYNYVALFRFVFQGVRDLVEETKLNYYFPAKQEATALNLRVTNIQSNGADLGVSLNSVSVLPLVIIDGTYKPQGVATIDLGTHTTEWKKYTQEEIATDANTDRLTIQRWLKYWIKSETVNGVTYTYDFSPMINQAEFDRKWDAITARIATQDTTYVVGIAKYLKAINGKTHIDLRNEEDINAAWALYNDGKSNKNLTNLRDFGPTDTDPLVYTFDLILPEADQEALANYKAQLNTLNAELNELNTFYSNLKTYAKWKYETGSLTLLQSSDKANKVSKKDGDTTKYLKADGTWDSANANGATVLALLQKAEQMYLDFQILNNKEATTAKATKLNETRDGFKVQNYMALSLMVLNAWDAVDTDANNPGKVEFEVLEYNAGFASKSVDDLLFRLNSLIAEYGDDTAKLWTITAQTLASSTDGTLASEFATMSTADAIAEFLAK